MQKTLPPEKLLSADESSPPAKSRFVNSMLCLAVLACILLAIAIRCQVLTEPLWLDELHTGWVVDGPLTEVHSRSAIGNQAPVYFWSVWLVTSAVGVSIFSLRLISLVAGALLIFIAARLILKWTKSWAATFCVVLLLALDPLMIFYSTEARPYGLLQLVGLLQIISLAQLWLRLNDEKAQGQPWRKLVMFSALSALLFYLHFTSVLLFAAEAVFLMVGLSIRKGRDQAVGSIVTIFLIAIVLAAIVCIPAFFDFALVLGRHDNWANVSSIEILLRELKLPILICIGLPLIVRTGLSLSVRKKIAAANSLSATLTFLFLICALAPVGIAVGCHRFGFAPIALTRYLVISYMAIFVFAGLAIGSINSKFVQWMLTIAILILSCLFNPLIIGYQKTGKPISFRHEIWDSPIAQVNNLDPESDDPVFLISNVLEDIEADANANPIFQEYLKFPVRGIYKIKNADRIVPLSSAVPRPFSDSHFKLMKAQRSSWILIRSTRQHAENVIESLQKDNSTEFTIEFFDSPDSDVMLVRAQAIDAR